MEMNRKNVQVSTEAAVHKSSNDCSTDFGKFPGKQLRLSPILLQLQAL